MATVSPASGEQEGKPPRFRPPLVRRLRTIDFQGVPGSSNTTRSATAKTWINAVRDQSLDHALPADPGDRFAAFIEFRLGGTLWKDQEWDVDNLLKAFFDALTDVGFFGSPAHGGRPLKGDERVDYLEVGKRRGREGEELGARLEVWLIARHESATP
jgi:Holliday junction resolvase RusA-like endonuclease